MDLPLNMKATSIYNIVNGKTKPSYDLLQKIITTFNINPAWLSQNKGVIILDRETNSEKTGVNPIVIKESRENVQYGAFLFRELARKSKYEDLIVDYMDIEGDIFFIDIFLKHYHTYFYMSDHFKAFRQEKITYNQLIETFKDRMQKQASLYDLIKEYKDSISKLYDIIDQFNNKNDRLYCLDDEKQLT
jgi:transcriptional regulator with XRE-family HTH domain